MAAHRYWRINVTKWRDYSTGLDGTTETVRAAEIKFVTAASATYPPTMTSGTAPSPYVVTGSGYTSSFFPFLAFDGSTADTNRWISASGVAPAWVTVDMGASLEFDRFRWAPDSQSNAFPVDFQVLASDIGSFTGEEEVIGDFVGFTTGWTPSTLREFALPFPPPAVHGDIGATLPALLSNVYGAARFAASLPPLSGFIAGSSSFAATLPAVVAYLRGGGSAVATLPKLGSHIVVVETAPNGITATLPALFGSAFSGASINQTLPKLQLSAGATLYGWAQIAATLPPLVSTSTGTTGGTIALNAQLPSLLANARSGGIIGAVLPAVDSIVAGKGGAVGLLVATLPSLKATSQATAQNYGSISAVLPMLQRVGSGRINVVLPSLQYAAAGGAVIAVTYEAYAINLGKTRDGQPYEVTHYSSFPFTKIVRYKDDYYGVAADGLYLLGGDTDAGQPIPSEWETHLADFGALQKKTPESMYISGRIGPTATGKVVEGEKASYTYPHLNPRGEFAQVHRLKLGKGIKSNYLGFGLADPAGGVMDIDLMDDRIPVLTRAI